VDRQIALKNNRHLSNSEDHMHRANVIPVMARVKDPTVTKRVAKGSKDQRVGYIRLSTLDQSKDRQVEGIELDRRFVDHVSGKDITHPQLTEMLTFVREADTVVASAWESL
jgi:hypothetical protein